MLFFNLKKVFTMKKLLAIAPIALVLTACGSAVHVAKPSPAQVQEVLANSQTFYCDNNAKVVSVLSERNGDNYANLQITAPSLTLNQASVQLKQVVSASGERYSVANHSTGYDWHAKGNEAILTVTNNGKTFNFGCSAQ